MKEIRRLFWTVGGIKGRYVVFAVTFFVLLIYLTSFTFAWEPNTVCDKGSECSGLAPSGSCGAQGVICIDEGTCSSYSYYDFWGHYHYENPSGCQWEFYAYCSPACYFECETFTYDYMSSDCDADCDLVFYNSCVCMCGGSGGGSQDGTKDGCTDRAMCM